VRVVQISGWQRERPPVLHGDPFPSLSGVHHAEAGFIASVSSLPLQLRFASKRYALMGKRTS